MRYARLKPDAMKAEISALKQARTRQMAFARYFNAQYTFPPEYLAGWIRSLPDDVPVCRCEDVTLGDVRRAVAEGFETPAGVKKATRCGMGICQAAPASRLCSMCSLPSPENRYPKFPCHPFACR